MKKKKITFSFFKIVIQKIKSTELKSLIFFVLFYRVVNELNAYLEQNPDSEHKHFVKAL